MVDIVFALDDFRFCQQFLQRLDFILQDDAAEGLQMEIEVLVPICDGIWK